MWGGRGSLKKTGVDASMSAACITLMTTQYMFIRPTGEPQWLKERCVGVQRSLEWGIAAGESQWVGTGNKGGDVCPS